MIDEHFVKNNVMNAKIDPMVVMDPCMFKVGGWNNSQLSDLPINT